MPRRASASNSANLPAPRRAIRKANRPRSPAEDIYDVLPADHRLPYDIEEVIFRIFDAGDYTEFQPDYAPEMLCANARLSGRPVGHHRQPPRLPEIRGAPAHRRHRLHRIGPQSGLLRRNRTSARATP